MLDIKHYHVTRFITRVGYPAVHIAYWQIDLEIDGRIRTFYGTHDQYGGKTVIYDIFNNRRKEYDHGHYYSSRSLHGWYLPKFYVCMIMSDMMEVVNGKRS